MRLLVINYQINQKLDSMYKYNLQKSRSRTNRTIEK